MYDMILLKWKNDVFLYRTLFLLRVWREPFPTSLVFHLRNATVALQSYIHTHQIALNIGEQNEKWLFYVSFYICVARCEIGLSASTVRTHTDPPHT